MSKTVADVMSPAPIVVEVPGSRTDAINIMVRNNLTGLPVIRAADGKLMGVVSRRDIFRNFEEEQLSLIMKKNCITTTPDTPVEEVAEVFSTLRIHRLPVVEDGKLIGIVTPTDLLKTIRDMKTEMVAEDVIRTTCVTAWEGEPLSYTIPAMRISDVSAVPVMDDHGRLVGILTDRDLFSDQVKNSDALKELGIADIGNMAGARNVLPLFYSAPDKYLNDERKVSDVMIRDPYSVFKKTNLSEVARMMISNDYGQVPVHGNKDELLGMIYDVDVLCALTGSK